MSFFFKLICLLTNNYKDCPELTLQPHLAFGPYTTTTMYDYLQKIKQFPQFPQSMIRQSSQYELSKSSSISKTHLFRDILHTYTTVHN